jgi:hypothetical protein
VTVGNTDLAGLVLPMHPAAKIRGHVVFTEGTTPPQRLLLFAQPANGDPSLGNPSGFSKPNDPTFEFTIEGLLAGTYLIDALSFGGMAPLSIMWNGRDMTDIGFDGSQGTDFDNVVLTLTSNFAELTGVVADPRGPAVVAQVFVFPVEPDRWTNYGWTPLRLRSVPAGSTGSYRVDKPGLPEGEYFVIAVDAAKGNAWLDPKFLAAAAPLATRVSVKWGEKSEVNLKVVDVVVK